MKTAHAGMQTLIKSVDEAMHLFRTLIVVMVSQVCIYIQYHQDVSIKYVQFFV